MKKTSPQNTRQKAAERGLEKYGPAAPRPKTENAASQIYPLIETIFNEACRGDKEAIKHLLGVAMTASQRLQALTEYEAKYLGPETAPLEDRKVIVEDLQKKHTHWPCVCIKKDGSKLDFWRDCIEKALVMFRIEDANFDNRPVEEKSKLLTNYWMPILRKYQPDELAKLADPIVGKSEKKKRLRRKSKLEEMKKRPYPSVIDSTKIQLAEAEIKAPDTEKRKPTEKEEREALQKKFSDRLKTMSPKSGV